MANPNTTSTQFASTLKPKAAASGLPTLPSTRWLGLAGADFEQKLCLTPAAGPTSLPGLPRFYSVLLWGDS